MLSILSSDARHPPAGAGTPCLPERDDLPGEMVNILNPAQPGPGTVDRGGESVDRGGESMAASGPFPSGIDA